MRPERDAYGRLILEYLVTGEGIEIVEVIDECEHVYVGVLEWVH